MAKQVYKIDNGKLNKIVVFVMVVGIVVGFGLHSLTGSFAASKPRAGTGSCYANPNPTPLRSTFTVYLSGMPANSIITYITQDRVGAGYESVMTDSLGNANGPDPYSAYVGTSKITATTTGNRKNTTLATCSVDIQ